MVESLQIFVHPVDFTDRAQQIAVLGLGFLDHLRKPLGYSDAFKQSLAFLILNKETGKALQHTSITPAIPLEEHAEEHTVYV